MSNSVHGGSVAAPAAQARPAARRSRREVDNLAGYLFIAPWLIGFFSFTLIPMVASLYFSFTDYDIFSAPRWIGLGNFQTMFFEDARYWKSVGATFLYVFTAVPLRLAFALGVAMLLNVGFSLLGLYRAIFYVPSIIGGSVAVALMWRQLFGGDCTKRHRLTARAAGGSSSGSPCRCSARSFSSTWSCRSSLASWSSRRRL